MLVYQGVNSMISTIFPIFSLLQWSFVDFPMSGSPAKLRKATIREDSRLASWLEGRRPPGNEKGSLQKPGDVSSSGDIVNIKCARVKTQ